MTEEQALQLGFRGAAPYADSFPGLPETEPRIYVEFRPQGAPISFLGLLDTGAPFCVLNREVSRLVEDQLTDPLGPTSLRTAYGPARGELYLLGITLVADRGKSHDFETVAFISPEWQAPSFLGYAGLLDRLRFAVDSQSNRFYFGSSDSS